METETATLPKDKGKLIKVTFEYEHEIHTMNDPFLVEKWIGSINGMCVEMHVRGRNPMESFDHKKAWEITQK